MKGSDRFFVHGVVCHYDGQPRPVANLSVGGFFVAVPSPPLKGQVLELGLALGRRPPFTILGTVSWVNLPPHHAAPELPDGFGVRITKIELRHKVALLDLLRRASEGSDQPPRRR